MYGVLRIYSGRLSLVVCVYVIIVGMCIQYCISGCVVLRWKLKSRLLSVHICLFLSVLYADDAKSVPIYIIHGNKQTLKTL